MLACAALTALFLSGCAAMDALENTLGPNTEQRMQAFVGRSEVDVLTAWGAPTYVTMQGTNKVLLYVLTTTSTGATRVVTSPCPQVVSGNTTVACNPVTTVIPGSNSTSEAYRVFILDRSGTVTGVRWRG